MISSRVLFLVGGWLLGCRLALEYASLTIGNSTSGTVTIRYMVQLLQCPIDKTE